MISSYSIRTINITNMFRAKTALVTVLVLLSCVSMQAQKADVFGTLVTSEFFKLLYLKVVNI